MTLAAAIESLAGAAAGSATTSIARVEVLRDFGSAETVWRRLEQSGLATPYQRFDFQSAWQRHIGEAEGLQPFIVIAYDSAGGPLLLMPLVVKQRYGARVAQFLGGKHVTFNMPLWQRDFAASAGKTDMDALLQGIRQQANGIDVLALERQPLRWTGIVNPISQLPYQVSVNDCPVLKMTPGGAPTDRVSNSFRKRLKGKERKYETLPGFRYAVATTDADVKRVLDMFFAIKPLRMAEQKLPNVFDEPGVENFIRAACMAPSGAGHAIDIHALECDEEVIAMFAGVADGDRFSMMFNTYTMSANAKYSPGLILMRNIIDFYAARGITALDLGIGSDDYKRQFCKDDEPIFDSFVPLTARGKFAAAALANMARAKRLVKQTPALMSLAHKLRGALQR
ncbi:GNAT family N-acetyltransferase [soil metagenome]